MASWTSKSPSGGSNRRKWNIEDRNSLDKLKQHFANEGSSNVQFELARQLLVDNNELNEETSHLQGIHWLLRAATQGHREALNLLKECYDQKRGISEENEDEVRCCLSMTPGERAARKAAKELFACLSNGNEHITPKQLERKMRKIYNLQKENRRRRHYSTSDEDDEAANNAIGMPQEERRRQVNGNLSPNSYANLNIRLNWDHDRHITQENLVSAAVNYSAGRMPVVNNDLTLSIPNPNALDHIPCFHRLIFHPVLFFTLLYHRLLNLISSFPETVPPVFKLAIPFIVYSLTFSDNIVTFVPIFFYYLCLATMVWSTCKMLKTKHDFIDFRIWSGLFISYGDNIEANISENRFLKNNMKPYLYFFCAFVGNLIVYPLVPTEWLSHSEITIVSCVFVFVSMIAFMYTTSSHFPDFAVLISFGINVLAKYPYEMDEVVTNGWRFLDLKFPTFCSFVIGNGIEFCLSCRTALYLMIPGVFVHLAKRSNWHGTYTHLIPHCVTLSWLQLCITTSRSATMFGVIRATLGLAGILLFLPLFGIVSLLIPVFVIIEWLGLTDPRIRIVTTFTAGAMALMGSCFLAANNKTRKLVTIFQIVICIVATTILILPYMSSNFMDVPRFGNRMVDGKEATVISTNSDIEDDVVPAQLTWEKFYILCGQPAWEGKNVIKAQLRCSHLDGVPVSWEGTVSNIKIAHVFNSRAAAIEKYLPIWLADRIKCMYGDNNIDHIYCESKTDNLCSEMIKLLRANNRQDKCNLNKWNHYEYEVKVRMSSGLLSAPIEVRLQASDKFGNFTRRLRSGDRVHFYGKLITAKTLPNGEREEFILGTSKPTVKISGIKCTQCQDKDLNLVWENVDIKSISEARMRELYRGIKYLLNVLFNPLITFK